MIDAIDRFETKHLLYIEYPTMLRNCFIIGILIGNVARLYYNTFEEYLNCMFELSWTGLGWGKTPPHVQLITCILALFFAIGYNYYAFIVNMHGPFKTRLKSKYDSDNEDDDDSDYNPDDDEDAEDSTDEDDEGTEGSTDEDDEVIQRTQLIGDTIVMENMSIVLTGLNMRMKMMKVIIARLKKYCHKQKKIKKMCNFIVQQLYFSGEIRLFY